MVVRTIDPMYGPRPECSVAIDIVVKIPYDSGTEAGLLPGVRDMGTTPAQMNQLIARHLAAEAAGDVAGAIAVYTDDVEHDVVGSPTGVAHGIDGARGFYEFLTSNIKTE